MDKKDLLKTIKQLRSNHKLTHQQIADKLGWGKQTYERLENGRTQNFNLDELSQIARVFGLTMVDLVNQATPEGQAESLLREGIQLFREAQEKIDEAERILGKKQ